jgi:hypothetical protein
VDGVGDGCEGRDMGEELPALILLVLRFQDVHVEVYVDMGKTVCKHVS